MNLKDLVDKKSYRTHAGSDWPSYNDFIEQNYTVPDQIANELDQFIAMMKDRYTNLVSSRTDELSKANQLRQGQVFFNKDYAGPNRCRYPWNTLGVNTNGNVFICRSPSWVPIFVGNILENNNIYEILNSNTAKKIRLEILENRYYYCNSKICGFFHSENPSSFKQQFTEQDTKPSTQSLDNKELELSQIPQHIIFDFDPSCNFKCPSCRTEYQNYNNHHVIRPVNDKLVTKIKKLIIDEIGDQSIVIRWAGGEPFMSEVYLDLFDYIIQTNKKNITNIVQTNGSLLKHKSDLLKKLLPFISLLRISFDAACEETYKLTRVGGNWNNLLENVAHVKNLIKEHNFNTVIQADFVVQKNNYKDLPLFAQYCREMNIGMNIQKMWNWGTWDTETSNEMNVYNTDHILYDDVKNHFKLANLTIAKN